MAKMKGITVNWIMYFVVKIADTEETIQVKKNFKLHDSESHFSSEHSYCISCEITVLHILTKK